MTLIDSGRPPPRRDLLATIMDAAVASHARAAALLLAMMLLAFVPGVFQLPVIDREEARIAQASKQMLETGDYFAIRFQDLTEQGQPVGTHWLQAASVAIGEAVGIRNARTTIWLYRLPSLLAAIGAVLLTYWAALALVSRRSALLAALMLAASVTLGVEARLAKGETALLLVAVTAMGALARLYVGARRNAPPDRRMAAVFWAALALGVLLNGLTLPLIAALCVATLAIADRPAAWLSRLYPASGLALFLALLLPWALFLALRRDEILPLALARDLLDVAVGQTGHRAFAGTYTLLFWVTFWPGAALAGLAAPAVWAARHEPGARVLLAWLVPAWILFELMSTKLPHYVLPLYPAAAVLIAGIIDPHVLARVRWLVRGTMWWFVFPVMASIGGIAIMMLIGRQLGLVAWPFAAAATIFGLLAWRLYEVDGASSSVLRAVIASVLLGVGMFGIMLPSLGVVFPTASVASAARSRNCPIPAAAAAGFHEPSIVFQLGTDTRLTDGAGAAEFLRSGRCRVAVVDSRHERPFATYAERVGLRYLGGPRIETYNFNAGRWMTLAVYYSEDFR
jgi:4-amino-4-deoxy-L-arabinose transferase-like glycosyltransferase